MGKFSSTEYDFPKIAIPESEKDEKWHRDFVYAIVNRSLGSNFDINYSAMNESINFFNGSQTGDEFRFLQEAEDGEVLPAQWITFNKIRTRIEILLGELQQKGYQINASSINKDAKARKLREKERARVNMRLAPDRQMLEQQVGLPLAPEGFLPKNEAELDDYYDFNFKEKNEVIMEYALRYLARKHNWSYERLAMFRDILVMGKCFVKLEIQDGLPFFRRVDPRFMVFDTNSTDDFLSDSTYFGEVQYMTIADAAAKYSLSDEEVKTVYNSYEKFIQATQPGSPGYSEFRTLNGTSINYFNTHGTDMRCLVMSAVWQDYKQLVHKRSEDKNGNEHIKRMSDRAQKGDLQRNVISQWRKGVLIGGEILKDWGVMHNQVRENESLADSQCPYKALVPHYLNGLAVSKVDQLKGLQKLKDITLYNVQLAMSRAGGKGFIYDTSQLPDGWDMHTMMRYLKTAGIAFVDSRKDGLPATHNQFTPIDQTISQSVEQYLAISTMIDSEMDAISGINDIRQGETKGASQAVGVTQSALFQSNLATQVYFDLFNHFTSNIFNYMGGLVKLSFAGNERYAPIIGDVGVNFLEKTMDLELDDFGVYIEETPPLLDDLQSFQSIVMAALQSGGISFSDAMQLLIEKDINVAIQRFKRIEEERQRKMQEAEAQAMAQQAQAAQAERQAEGQVEFGKIEKKGEIDLRKQALQNEGDMNEVLAKGRIGMAEGKIDFTQALALEKIKQRAEDRKEQANPKPSK